MARQPTGPTGCHMRVRGWGVPSAQVEAERPRRSEGAPVLERNFSGRTVASCGEAAPPSGSGATRELPTPEPAQYV